MEFESKNSKMTMKYKNEIELSLVKQRNKKDERAADKRQQAKCWTYYVETLKRTIDCLYEICRSEQSIIGCKVDKFYKLFFLNFINFLPYLIILSDNFFSPSIISNFTF